MQDFTLQIHITGKCNCRCKHCYISEHAGELTPHTISEILDQYQGLIAMLQAQNKETFRPLVNITGGEPFLYSELDSLFEIMERRKDEFVFRIATNGTLLDDRILGKLKKLSLPFVQVSLDGNEEIHDGIRGKGNFRQVLEGLDRLHTYGIPSRVSFTAHKGNYKTFPEVANICRQHGVHTLWSDRYVPCEEERGIVGLSREETGEYVAMLASEKKNPANFEAGLSVQNYRALQFLSSGAFPYHCTAGIYSIAIDENGDVFPCRRMFLKCGNIYQETLQEIYFHSPVFQELQGAKAPEECANCPHASFCKGGSKCQSYALYQNLGRKDPGCWL